MSNFGGNGGIDQSLNLSLWPQQWHSRKVYYLVPEISYGQIPNTFIAKNFRFYMLI